MWTALHTQIDFFFNTFHMENPTVGPPTYTNSDKQQLKNSPQTHAHTHAQTGNLHLASSLAISWRYIPMLSLSNSTK